MRREGGGWGREEGGRRMEGGGKERGKFKYFTGQDYHWSAYLR